MGVPLEDQGMSGSGIGSFRQDDYVSNIERVKIGTHKHELIAQDEM